MSPQNANTDIQYTFKIFRFDPDVDSPPRYDTFVKTYPRGRTVLERF